MLSGDSIVKVRLFEAWPSKPLLGKYFEIIGHMDLDESRYHACLSHGRESKRGKEDRMSTATSVPGGKGGTVVWNQTVKALCYPSMCLMGSVAERSKALV